MVPLKGAALPPAEHRVGPGLCALSLPNSGTWAGWLKLPGLAVALACPLGPAQGLSEAAGETCWDNDFVIAHTPLFLYI